MNIAYFIKPKSSTAFIYDTSTLRQGIEKMRAHGFSAVPVLTREGNYFGTVTEGDFLWNTYGKSDPHLEEKLQIRDILRPDRHAPLNVQSSMEEMLRCAMEMNFVPVVDDRGYFVGIITRKDVMRYFFDKLYGPGGEERAATPGQVRESFGAGIAAEVISHPTEDPPGSGTRET